MILNKQLVLAATCVAGVSLGLGLETQAALATGFGGQVLPANAIVNGYSLTDAAEVHSPWLMDTYFSVTPPPLPVTPFEQLVFTADSYTVTDSTYLYLPIFFANDIPPAFPDPFPTNLADARVGIFDPSQGALSFAVSVNNQTTVLGPEYLVGPINFTVDDDGDGIASAYKGYQQATFLSPLSPGAYTVGYEVFQAGNSIFTGAYTIQSNPTPVPTPALLPGLIAFGLSALRKRQGEEVSDSEVQV
jgi:hypothetical protein